MNKELFGRALAIAQGKTNLSEEKRRKYLEIWAEQGYDVTPFLNLANATLQPPAAITSPTEEGPGTEYALLAATFAIVPVSSCSCNNLKQQMNALGAAGCLQERETLLTKLTANYQTLTLIDKLKALWYSGLPPWLNPLSPVSSMFDEAVRRAALKEATAVTEQESAAVDAENSRLHDGKE